MHKNQIISNIKTSEDIRNVVHFQNSRHKDTHTEKHVSQNPWLEGDLYCVYFEDGKWQPDEAERYFKSSIKSSVVYEQWQAPNHVLYQKWCCYISSGKHLSFMSTPVFSFLPCENCCNSPLFSWYSGLSSEEKNKCTMNRASINYFTR